MRKFQSARAWAGQVRPANGRCGEREPSRCGECSDFALLGLPLCRAMPTRRKLPKDWEVSWAAAPLFGASRFFCEQKGPRALALLEWLRVWADSPGASGPAVSRIDRPIVVERRSSQTLP